MSKAIVPSSAQPISQGGGIITTVWLRFFNALVSSPASVEAITPSQSPYSFKPSQTGSLTSSGGSGVALTFKRASATVGFGASATIPVSIGDEITIEYTTVPTVFFIPF